MRYIVYLLLVPVIALAQLTPYHFKTVNTLVTSADVTATVNSAIQTSRTDTSGLIFIASGSVIPDVTVSGTYVKVTGWTAGVISGMTFAGDSLKVSAAGTYLLNFSASFSGTTNDVIVFRCAINGAKQASFQSRNDISLGILDKNSGASFVAKFALTANAGVSIWVTNTAGTTDPTITNATVFLKKL